MDLKSLFSPNAAPAANDASGTTSAQTAQPNMSNPAPASAPDSTQSNAAPVQSLNNTSPLTAPGGQSLNQPLPSTNSAGTSMSPATPPQVPMAAKLGENLAPTSANSAPTWVAPVASEGTPVSSAMAPTPALASVSPLNQNNPAPASPNASSAPKRRRRSRSDRSKNQTLQNDRYVPDQSSPVSGDQAQSSTKAETPLGTLATTLNKLGDDSTINTSENSASSANNFATAFGYPGQANTPAANNPAQSSTPAPSPAAQSSSTPASPASAQPSSTPINSSSTTVTPATLASPPEVNNSAAPSTSNTTLSQNLGAPAKTDDSSSNTSPVQTLVPSSDLNAKAESPAIPTPPSAEMLSSTAPNEAATDITNSANDASVSSPSPTVENKKEEATPAENTQPKSEAPKQGLGGFSLNELVKETANQTPLNTILTAQKTGGVATQLNSLSSDKPYSIFELLDLVVERDASDLHITVGYPVMIRIDGSLVPVGGQLVTPEIAADLINPLLPENKKELLEVNREVDLAYQHKEGARFRINAYYQKQTMAAACRLIPNEIRTIDQLNLPQIYHQLTKLNQGLVLVTGPTGSGKSTTLAAILNEVNETRPDHIITIEDPIEYILPPRKAMVDQRELHEDTHSWEIALKSALRQDPDVMLVGEMRDFETISSAITLAETGHLVFATLHTNSASQTLDRIIDVFPEFQQSQVRAQLSNVIEAIIAQRLVPLRNGGRRAVSEIMIATPAVRNLIREAKTHQLDNVIATSADIGMVSIEHSLVALVREGVITTEVAQEYAVHPEEVTRLLKA